MHVHFRLASIGIVTLLLTVPVARAETPPNPYTESTDRTAIVTIRRSGLRPARIIVGQGQQVLWRNDSGSAAQVILPDDLASRMACGDVRPTFARVARGDLASRPLRSSGLVLPCELPPGTYAYRVDLVPSTGGMLQGVAPTLNAPPLRSFRGELVVR